LCQFVTTGRWNLEAAVGPSFIVGGDAVTGDQANITGLNNIKMKDAYDTGFRAELGAALNLVVHMHSTRTVR